MISAYFTLIMFALLESTIKLAMEDLAEYTPSPLSASPFIHATVSLY